MKKFYIITMIILINLSHVGISFSKINIIASVNNEIITNYDVLKESRYLKILSPTLLNLMVLMIQKNLLIVQQY